MRLAITLFFALAAGDLAPAQRFDAELLVAHPADFAGDSTAHRSALLAALEAEPAHPLALLAGHRLSASLDDVTADELRRMAVLAATLADAEARTVLAALVERERLRTLFAEAPPELPAGGDSLGHFDTWYAVGPFGELDHPAPAAQPAPPDSPEVLRWPDREAYGAVGAVPRVWRRCALAGQLGTFIRPSDVVYPSGGVTYAVAVVTPREPLVGGRAVLELRAPGALRAWWNGALVVDEAHSTLTERARERFRIDVAVQPGPNVLLVRIVTEEQPLIAACLLEPDGRRVVAVDAPDASPWTLKFTLPAAQTVRSLPLWDDAEGGGALQPALRMFQALVERRPDQALAVPAPDVSDGDAGVARVAWLHQRLAALEMSTHLPEEVERRQTLEALDQIEREAARAGIPVPALARRMRANRLSAEDRPREALAVVDAWLADHPTSFGAAATRIGVLQRLDREGVLARIALEALVTTHPQRATGFSALAGARRRVGDEVGALAAARAALQLDANADDAYELVVGLAARAGDLSQLEWLLARIEAAAARRPDGTDWDARRLRILEYLGRDEERLQLLERRAAAAPYQPDLHWRVGDARLASGDVEGARAAFRRELELDPADPTTRETLRMLGDADSAERFFAAFGPDVPAALARAAEVQDTSVVEALDSGLVYFFPDGSSQSRMQTLSIPRDRSGTEALHVHDVLDDTRVARVLTRDGRELEPVEVDGEWTLPALEPGDVVEFVWDRFDEGVYGAPPTQRSWRFSSFEKAFPTSRWVVYVPDGLPGRLALVNFDGQHEEVRYEGGTVHILSTSHPKQIEEPLRPSDAEVLPIAAYSGDYELDGELLSWQESLPGLTEIPADLEAELLAFVGERRADTSRATAEALYTALDTRTGEQRGDARAAAVWASRRGLPLFLLGALYARAGVPFEWAVIERPFAPELDPEPVVLFENTRELDRFAMRLGVVDASGEPIWIIPTGAPGFRFGAIPDEMAGAPVFVHGVDGWRKETLPVHQMAASSDAAIEVEYAIGDDGSATVTGTFRVTSAQGDILRRQLREAPAERREAFARQRVGSVVRGLDIATAQFALDDPEPGLTLAFSGTLPRFVVERGGELQADPPFLPLGLDRSFGAAERRWPLAARSMVRVRVRARIVHSAGLEFLGGPLAIDERRPGQHFRIAVDATTPGQLALEQEYHLRGLRVDTAEMAAFVTRMGELEAELRRPLRWRRAP